MNSGKPPNALPRFAPHALLLSLLFSIAFATTGGTLTAATPVGGLLVAISPDGTRLVAGGETRTLIVLDPESLAVTHREWIGRSITNLTFSKDGTTLAVQDTSDTVVLFDTSDWTSKAEIAKRAAFAAAPAADIFVAHDGSYDGPTIHGHTLTDGGGKFTIALPKEARIAALGLSSDGKKLAVLTEGEKDASETEVPYAELPKDLKGIDLDDFKQKNDGRTASLLFFDTSNATKVSESKIHYTSSTGTKLVFNGDDLLILNYTNLNARITPAGEITLFKLAHGLNYGLDVSLDGKSLLGGGMNNYSITGVDGLSSVSGTTDKLPSWPEYWKGFASVAQGSPVYGGTSAYRVFKLDSAGAVLKSEPVR